ncbi:MAG TPA: DMT family transporter [Flavisolibacter sp.]|nr:DMT family transporter [Flavisolibacter sp.]
MSPSTKAHIAVLFTNIFFAANYSLLKMVSPNPVGPFAINVVRVGVSLVLFWVIWLFGKTDAGIKRQDIGKFLMCGLMGIAINQMFFVTGLTMTTTIHAALLILLSPIIITIFALWVLKERFTFYKAIGLSLGIGGSVFLILQKESGQHAPNYLLGDLFILVNAFSYSIYFIMVKPLMERYSPLHVIRWVFTIGFFMILPFSWNQTAAVDWAGLRLEQYGILVAVSVFGTFLAYYFNIYGIQNIGAGATGTYIYTQPIFVVIIAAFLVGETFTWQKFVAGLLIFAGVFLVSYKNGRNKKLAVPPIASR